jgi:hypothetical protein
MILFYSEMNIDELVEILKQYPEGIVITDLVEKTGIKYPKLANKIRKLKWSLIVYHEGFFDETREFRIKIKHMSFKSDYYIEFYVKDVEYYDDFILNTLYNTDFIELFSPDFFEKYAKEYDFYIIKNRVEYLKNCGHLSYILIFEDIICHKYFFFKSWKPTKEISDNFKKNYNNNREIRIRGYANEVDKLKDKMKVYEENMKRHEENILKKQKARRIYEENMRSHFEKLKKVRNTIVIIDLPNLVNSVEKYDLNIFKLKNPDKFKNLSSIFRRKLLTNIDRDMFEIILKNYVFTEMDRVHNFVFFSTPKYQRFNQFISDYKIDNDISSSLISLKIFCFPIINTKYFKDIDRQMNDYIHYISKNLAMKRFVIVTGDSHFYESIYRLAIKNIRVHIIAHEGSMSKTYNELNEFNEENNIVYSFALIKRNEYLNKVKLGFSRLF